jgi:cation diffusion facilitator family transporter
MFISLFITIALVVFLNFVAKKTKNMVIKSDALHYKTDVYTNGAILVSLALISLTGIGIIDSIMGAAIALYIIYSAYEIIKDGVYVLLDASLDEKIVNEIKNILKNEPGVNDYHYLKTRKSGKTNFVDVHIVLTPHISLLEAHTIADKVEEKIALLDKEDDWVVTIHLDPYDDSVSFCPRLSPKM